MAFTQDDTDADSAAYHAADAAVAYAVAKAYRKAQRELAEDAAKLLSDYSRLGGFSSSGEALAYLKGYTQSSGLAVLIARAETLAEPYRTQWLVRLSSPAYLYRLTRKEAVAAANRMIQGQLQRDITAIVTKRAGIVRRTAVQRTLYGVSREAGLAVDLALPNKEVLAQLGSESVLKRNVHNFVTRGYGQSYRELMACAESGRPYAEYEARIAKLRDVPTYAAKRFVRTAMTDAAAEAQAAEYDAMGITQYEFVCTLDEKTCPICQGLDHTVHALKDRAIGVNAPSMHPNCRCTMHPVVRQSLRDGWTRAARDSGGHTITVPESTTYAEWAKVYAPKVDF